MRVAHELVSHDGSGYVFRVRDHDNRDLLDGFISGFDGKLVVTARSRGKLDSAGVAEMVAAWKMAFEIVQLHVHCFIWKLEFQVEFPTGEIRDFIWYIWAPTAEVAYERLLNSVANDSFVSEDQRVVCDAAMKGTWVRA